MTSERFEMRVDSDLLERLDAWRQSEDDRPSRAEAIRRLIEAGLAHDNKGRAPHLTDGEKLIAIMMAELIKKLDVDVETNVDLVQKVILGGHIDTLVHSAGVQRRKPLIAENPEDALTMKDMDWVYDINARAGFATVLAALPYMKNDAKGRSQITFLSSVHGLIGCPDSGPYCASKWAIEGFMHANKHELAKYGIRINAVNPAFIETALAIGPLKTIAGNVVTKQGLKPDDAGYQEAFDTAFEEAKQERLHLQINPETGKGEWIPMKDITDAVAGLADFSNGIGSGGNVQPDYGYVERGKEEAGAAIFEFKGQERGLRAALEAFDARNAKLAAGQGSGRGPRGG
jgi:NAD(P)-dependent dehydrogenase (short-subunit alcohol dehydrogenase family)